MAIASAGRFPGLGLHRRLIAAAVLDWLARR